MRRILIICPYPLGIAPSQRFRYEQYIGHLEGNGFAIDYEAFLSNKDYQRVFQFGNPVSKILGIALSYIRRTLLLFKVSGYDFIFIHREATPAGLPYIEWIIARLLKKKIIYDFDDAIWLTDNVNESSFSSMLRCRWKVAVICRWSYKVSCGNRYLADYAARFNKNVIVNPTTIDTTQLHNPTRYIKPESDAVHIGWTGSHSTLKYLKEIESVLQNIETRFSDVKLLVIADRLPELKLRNVIFKRWSAQTEISDLMLADIGIMPLPDDEWAKGKCGFKALQYMSLEIPAVVSAVGVNNEIVRDGTEGYTCNSADEWVENLERLILDKKLRMQMGERGRQRVIDHYSVASNALNFRSLFQEE